MTKQYDENMMKKINELKENLGEDLYYSLPDSIIRDMLGEENTVEEHG